MSQYKEISSSLSRRRKQEIKKKQKFFFSSPSLFENVSCSDWQEMEWYRWRILCWYVFFLLSRFIKLILLDLSMNNSSFDWFEFRHRGKSREIIWTLIEINHISVFSLFFSINFAWWKSETKENFVFLPLSLHLRTKKKEREREKKRTSNCWLSGERERGRDLKKILFSVRRLKTFPTWDFFSLKIYIKKKSTYCVSLCEWRLVELDSTSTRILVRW